MPHDDEQRSVTTTRLELFATILLISVTVIVGGLTVWDRVNAQPAEVVRQEPPAPPTLPDEARVRARSGTGPRSGPFRTGLERPDPWPLPIGARSVPLREGPTRLL